MNLVFVNPGIFSCAFGAFLYVQGGIQDFLGGVAPLRNGVTDW